MRMRFSFGFHNDRRPARLVDITAFVSATAKLSKTPLLYGLAHESKHLRREVRQAFLRTRRGRMYRILFIVAEDAVRVLRIRGPGQPPITARDLC